MRNLTMKSQFTKPNTTHSFKKSERKYPQKMPIQSKKYSRSECEKEQSNEMIIQNSAPQIKTIQILPSNMKKFRYKFGILDPFPIYDRNSKSTTVDSQCAWFKWFQRSPHSKKTILQMKRTSYTISDWQGDLFPHSINICMDGMIGYFDMYNQPTERIASLLLRNIHQQLIDGVKNYELIYEIEDSVSWQIPPSLSHIKFYLTTDDEITPIQLPLPNQLDVEFQIKQQ